MDKTKIWEALVCFPKCMSTPKSCFLNFLIFKVIVTDIRTSISKVDFCRGSGNQFFSSPPPDIVPQKLSTFLHTFPSFFANCLQPLFSLIILFKKKMVLWFLIEILFSEGEKGIKIFKEKNLFGRGLNCSFCSLWRDLLQNCLHTHWSVLFGVCFLALCSLVCLEIPPHAVWPPMSNNCRLEGWANPSPWLLTAS